jgi:hypothetical protein
MRIYRLTFLLLILATLLIYAFVGAPIYRHEFFPRAVGLLIAAAGIATFIVLAIVALRGR